MNKANPGTVPVTPTPNVGTASDGIIAAGGPARADHPSARA